MVTNIVEQCQVAPSSTAATELLLPLLYFDIPFLSYPLPEHLIFYSFQCSESHFLDTIVPNLKNSLSLTLKHFSPLAGKIIFPLSSGMPVSHYVAGDSISLTIAKSNADFSHVTGNLSRDSDQFHEFVADLPPATYLSDFIKFSVAAVQVTLFPNQGICVGITHHHAISDGSTFSLFVQAWASISKFNGDARLLALGQKSLPFYHRSSVQDANSLTTTYWNHMKMRRPKVFSNISLPGHQIRATFVLSEAEIQKLKNFVLSKKPSMARVSSFAIVCALVWTSLARSAAAAGEEVADDESEYFNCAADCRARLNHPLPGTYFGNCLTIVLAESTHGRLKGDGGIVHAAEAICEAIQKTINNDRGILEGSMNRFLELGRLKMIGNRILGIIGSSIFDPYAIDFGWGRPKKYELAHIDFTGSVCFCKSRVDRGVEIGLSRPRVKMDAFAAIFNQGLKEAAENIYNQLSKL